jgi:hypothetical protein
VAAQTYLHAGHLQRALGRLTYGDKAFKTKTAQNAGGNATFEEIAEFERDPKINTLKVRGTSLCGTLQHLKCLRSRTVQTVNPAAH